jgi:hypothetical protein
MLVDLEDRNAEHVPAQVEVDAEAAGHPGDYPARFSGSRPKDKSPPSQQRAGFRRA